MMTWDDLPAGTVLIDYTHLYIKMDQERAHFSFSRRGGQEFFFSEGMHGSTDFGWSDGKGFFPVEYLY